MSTHNIGIDIEVLIFCALKLRYLLLSVALSTYLQFCVVKSQGKTTENIFSSSLMTF